MKRNTVLAFVLMATCLAVEVAFLPVIKAQTTEQQKAELLIQNGHADSVNTVAFSPNGKILASGGSDKVIKLWNIETGQLLKSLEGHAESVLSVAFSPDGKMLASGGADKTVKLWNVATGREIKLPEGHAGLVRSVAFSPDSQTLASGSDDKTVKLWNVGTGQLITKLEGHTSYVFSVAFSPDGNTLATGSDDKTIKLWSVVTKRLVTTLTGHTDRVASVAFSPDGQTLASGSADKTIKLWNVVSGKQTKVLRGSTSFVNSVAFSPDGKTLASGDSDEALNSPTVKLWNVATGQLIKSLDAGISFVNSVAFSADGKFLASGSHLLITLWNVKTGLEIKLTQPLSIPILTVACSPDGQIFASANFPAIRLWNAESGQQIKTLRGHTDLIQSIAFSPNGATLASGSADKTIKLWNVESGQLIKTLEGHSSSVFSVAFSPDGKMLASGSGDTTTKLWDVATGRELKSLPGFILPILTVAFSPDGKTLASGGYESSGKYQTIKLWNVETGREIKSLEGHTDLVQSIAFAPDGKTLASGSADKTVKLWDVETGRLIKSLAGHTQRVQAIAFSADGKTLASGSEDRTIKLWSVETGQLLKSLEGHANTIESVAFSPDGKLFVSGSRDGTMKLWDKQSNRPLATLTSLNYSDWMAVTPDGFFDGTPAAWERLSWRLSESLYDVAPAEAFFSEFFRPGVLAEIFAGRTVEPPKRKLEEIDIRQPEVMLALNNAKTIVANTTARQVTVKVTVKDAPANERRQNSTSGAKDVRLFRNGALVAVWRGDVLGGKESITLTATVPITAGDNNFTAYAFNNENVKSRDGELLVKGADSLRRKGTAYILAVGVNEYANPQYNLKYAVADARTFTEEIKNQQGKLGQYERVEITTLFDREATKPNIIRALAQLPSKVQPEDAVFVYFAGHGTAQQNRFYLIPHDLGYAGARTSVDEAGLKELLAHSISDKELEAAFEKVDAGQILFVIDACNSGQALEAEEKRRGPMNSKGLAQLAYEKGMYILTAAQSYQAAQEASQLGHGLLTYALVEEGLKQAAADDEPKDGQIYIREWLDYATSRVPQMQIDKMKAARGLGLNLSFKEEERGLDVNRRSGQQPRVFYRRELEANPLVVAKSETRP